MNIYEMIESMSFEDLKKAIENLNDLQKSTMYDILEEMKKSISHKYLRREGTPGNYKYFYYNPETKKEYSSDKKLHNEGGSITDDPEERKNIMRDWDNSQLEAHKRVMKLEWVKTEKLLRLLKKDPKGWESNIKYLTKYRDATEREHTGANEILQEKSKPIKVLENKDNLYEYLLRLKMQGKLGKVGNTTEKARLKILNQLIELDYLDKNGKITDKGNRFLDKNRVK